MFTFLAIPLPCHSLKCLRTQRIYDSIYYPQTVSKQETLQYVTYCGLYCKLCSNNCRIKPLARELQKTLIEESFTYFFHPDSPFWKVLDELVKMDCRCRAGGGPPDCGIRDCARGKAVESCPQCKEYPCARILEFAETYPNLVQDGKRQRKIGLEKWVREQEERAKRGVVFTDMRIPRE